MKQHALPQHIAIIMDGNGRYAKQRLLPRTMGHRVGLERAHELVEHCGQKGIMALTLFTFSSENWRRPQEEVSFLMKLFLEALAREIKALHANDVQVKFIGQREHLPTALLEAMQTAEALTQGNSGLKLRLAMNYGGRADIVQATKAMIKAVQEGKQAFETINETLFQTYLSTADLPDPDLLIRTGGERRISNFLIWQSAYSELYFSDKLFPEFDAAALEEALVWYQTRERRFGQTGEQMRV